MTGRTTGPMTGRVIIAGGGLSGVLAAVALRAARPDLDLVLLEAGDRLGGDHTWSFYETDLGPAETALVEPFVAHRWDGYETRFDGLARTFSTGYRSVTSAVLHARAMDRLGAAVRLSAPVAELDAGSVRLADGTRLSADLVLDARGPRRMAGVSLAWQKFLGREVRLVAPHGERRPTIMDATVPQLDGYRFVYLLPFSPDRILIEDTYYADGADIDAAELGRRVDAYAAARGWTIAAVEREERGALPILLAGDFGRFWKDAAPAGGPAPLGLRAGLFHAVTGYSLPASARAATAIAGLTGPLGTARVAAEIAGLVRRQWRAAWFDRLLNRQLFLAARPGERHRLLARFHRLPQPLIERFYAGRLAARDMARIFYGDPPVPIHRALLALPERAAPAGRR